MSSPPKDPQVDGPSLALHVLQKQLEDLQSQVATLTTDLDAAKIEAAKMKDLAARSQADLQNAKARMERERAELAAFALEAMLKKLLPTIDSFQRAFQHLPEDLKSHEWVKGVIAIERQLLKELETAGLQRMSSIGSVVDPQRHEVLQQGPGEKDVVTAVFEEGYEMHGKVLRPATVKAGDGTKNE
jgi:molecular chaperone GrpE